MWILQTFKQVVSNSVGVFFISPEGINIWLMVDYGQRLCDAL